MDAWRRLVSHNLLHISGKEADGVSILPAYTMTCIMFREVATIVEPLCFIDVELNERMLELIIASTPYDSFRKDLLGKPIGYTTAETLQEGRKYEAITAGDARLQQMARVTEEVHAMHTHDRKCNNCGITHKPRQCPAYRDACNSCGAIGHWEKCCRKKRQNQQTRKPSEGGTQRRSHSSKRNKYGKHNKGNKAAHSLEVETGYETGGESYQQEFYAVNLSSKSLDSIGQDKKSRDEAYTRLKIRPPGIRTKNCSLLLKIDTGASGNTLPKRTFQHMYGTHSYHLLEPANNVILTAYNGATIECLGKLDMLCRYKDEKWTKATFYVVDVPGPAVVGLPTSKQLHLVTINVDSVADTRGTKSTPQPVIPNVNDMKRAYPQQFDTVGNFAGEAKLLLKDDAEAFIDAPRKCSIHMKEKHRDLMQERQSEMKDQHDKTSRKEDLPSLYTGQAVRILNHQRKTWCPGKIVSKCDEPRSYVVETPKGTRLRCNRSHLRELMARRELVASPAKTVRFSDEPARPTQTIQQHVPDQPDTVDVTDSQREKEETTQCVASTRSGRRVRVPVRYQHN